MQGDFLMPEVADYHEKLQFFVLFYIDCANYIEPDPDWRVFFLYPYFIIHIIKTKQNRK